MRLFDFLSLIISKPEKRSKDEYCSVHDLQDNDPGLRWRIYSDLDIYIF